MFRSLHSKLVLILVLLIVSVMAVVGSFLINSVSTYYLDRFYTQTLRVFNNQDVRQTLYRTAAEAGAEGLSQVLGAHQGALGISDHRNFYILDGAGQFLAGSNENLAGTLVPTPTIIAAMTGDESMRSTVADSVVDLAVPIDVGSNGTVDYILYLSDDKAEVGELSWRFFQIVLQAMMFGLLAAILLSFLLSKTIATPIERITEGALLLAKGNFDQQLDVQSFDEIGELTGSFNDMAARLKAMVSEVADERDKLSTLFLHMTDGVAAFLPDGQLLHINPAAESLLGVRMSTAPSFQALFPDLVPEDRNETATNSFTTRELTRHGKILSITLAPYGVDRESGVITVLHDITEQRKLEQARREFVANVSHELRTPLTNIRSYTETLLDAGADLPADTQAQFLTVISNESERMAHIVTDLLTLSRLDCGRMELRLTRFSFADLLQQAAEGVRLTAENQHQTLLVNAPNTLPLVTGDRGRLTQVIVNLLSNALKYTPAGGQITVTATERDKQQICVTVQDNGIGIPAEDVPHLFERFYRVDKARSRAAGGTGLGLAIAKEIIQQHGGTIALESEYGKGTVVTLLLPLTAAREGEAPV